jgi:two-component system, NtrC family, response regulator AtoC
MPQILIVDDDPAMCGMVEAGLRSVGFVAHSATSPSEALTLFARADYDCVITDVRMGTANGIDLCAELVQRRTGVPVVVTTAFGSIQTAIDAIRAGAFEFLVKPFELDVLRHIVTRAIENRSLHRRVHQLEQTVRELEAPKGLVASSEPMKHLQQLVGRAAASDVGVLVLGESGSGKEVVARLLHELSPRRKGPFVVINCAALPETLIESELFGQVRGNGAEPGQDRSGLFVQAQGGSLFLDEIGELPLSLQPKLLRVLHERTVRPIGASTEIPLDARIIAASNRDLEQAVAGGQFRQDLYYRIQVVQLDVPPLRTRGNDVLLLAQQFIEAACKGQGRPAVAISRAAAEKLLEYNWPGNVRELHNCIVRAITLSDGQALQIEDLPERIRSYCNEPSATTGAVEFVPLDEIERRHILGVLRAVTGRKSLAARILGLNRKTLYRKLRQYGVAVESDAVE